MDNIKQLDDLVGFMIANRLPKEMVINMCAHEYEKTNKWLSGVGTSGVTAPNIEGTNIKAHRLCYAEFTFHLICLEEIADDSIHYIQGKG
jgi:hypothetical protein